MFGFTDLRAFLETLGEPVNQPDVHAAEETERARLGRHRREDADQIRAFVLLEHERRDVRQLAHAVDDREVNIADNPWRPYRESAPGQTRCR